MTQALNIHFGKHQKSQKTNYANTSYQEIGR
jgi:hypothetical protein